MKSTFKLKPPMSLHQDSVYYKDQNNVYERFAEAEDSPGRVLNILNTLLKDKNVLDAGCGTGKYTNLLKPVTRSIKGIDRSPDQISLAQQKYPDLNFQVESLDQITPSNYDAAVCAWVLGTITDDASRNLSLDKLKTAASKIVCIENGINSEFEVIRGRVKNTKTHQYNNWLLHKGFKLEHKIHTWFDFDSKDEASRIIGAIWGPSAGDMVQSSRIDHIVDIYILENGA